tara:strand:+ start:405 stop:668 length:264 start_codon:yes stop_codon:yes gene_type:complete
MIGLIIFLLGLFLGWAATKLRLRRVEIERARSEMNDEIDLRATPDNYLSEVQLMKKRYIEAKWQERLELANKNLLGDSKFITKQEKS